MKTRYDIILFFVLLCLTNSCGYLPEETLLNDRSFIYDERADYFMVYNGMNSPSKIMIFIPGAFVDPYAYVGWMKEITRDELAVVVLKYPSNFALSNIQLYEKVVERYTYIEEWIIAGHSLGGVAAAKIISEHSDTFEGLVLMGSYTTSIADLSKWEGSVLSIYASEDAYTTPGEVEENKKYLPDGRNIGFDFAFPDTTAITYYYEIEGGNHSNFGNYGFQKGDNEAMISQDEQWAEMVALMNNFIQALFQ